MPSSKLIECVLRFPPRQLDDARHIGLVGFRQCLAILDFIDTLANRWAVQFTTECMISVWFNLLMLLVRLIPVLVKQVIFGDGECDEYMCGLGDRCRNVMVV